MKKILFFGYYGEGNLGDELLLKNLKDYFSKDFILGVLTSNKSYYKNLTCFDKFNPKEVLKAVNWTDIVIGGGGGIFQDKTSLRSLLYYLSIIWLSFIKKKRVYLIGQSFSTFKYPISKFLVKISLPFCQKIYVRDKLSFDILNNIGISGDKVSIIPDLVFLTEIPEIKFKKNNVGINFRPWRGINLKELENILINLKNQEEKLIFFSFQDSLDLELFNKFPMETRKDVEIISFNNENFWDKFSSCKYFVGMRLHSLILASIMGIPFLGLSYDDKIDAYLNDLGWKYYLSIYDLNKFLPTWKQLKEEGEELELYLKIKIDEKRKILKEELEKVKGEI
ncbi:MAG: polysaccharide pyruvyl transferase CsaB [Dictyoglomaceae bacterium]